jgi:3-hydroxyisobutyrate dehydrogenase-like beta-hydroxyacid dehydrogenase
MAANLAQAEGPLTVWNRSADKAEALAAEVGCEWVESAAEAGAGSEVVFTMLADGDALDDVLFGAGELASSLRGKVLVDMSTIGPERAREVGRRLGEAGVRFVEAPVSGSIAAAEARRLMIMVGAAEEDFAAVRDLLAAIGDPIFHLGEVGAGSTMKLVINSLVYSLNHGLSEALVLAESAGLDTTVVYDTIMASAVASPAFTYRRNAFLAPGEGPTSFTLTLEDKDLGLITELAGSHGASMPQAELNRQIVRAAIAAGHGDEDIAAIAQYLREESDG